MVESGHIADSAFLVNESRARNVPLSRDRFARLWVNEATRRLWEDFSREVYPHDAIELGLRNRFFLERLTEQVRRRGVTCFVNLGAGFTSYPFLLDESLDCVEVDFPHVLAYKKTRVDRWQREGRLPRRRIAFLPADLNDPDDLRALEGNLQDRLAGAVSFFLAEGLTYYLPAESLQRLFALCARVQGEGSFLAFDFWTPAVEGQPVFQRFVRFCADRFGHRAERYNLLSEEDVASLPGYEVIETTDVQALEREFAGTSVLADPAEILPENYALLVRQP